MNRRSTMLHLAALLLSAGPATAEQFDVVVRTFIPNVHESVPGFAIPVPGDPSKTMFKGPPLTGCFLTDNRGFSTEMNATSRFGGKISIDVQTGAVSWTTLKGVTSELKCDTGEQICQKHSGEMGFSVVGIQSGRKGTAAFKGAASNPCLAVAPNIEFNGIVAWDLDNRLIKVTGNVDVFPAFEGFLVLPGGSTKTFFEVAPKLGSTPIDLVTSSANRSVAGEIHY